MLEFVRKRGRSFIANALYYSGVLWLMAAIRFRHRALVLTYHRVLPADADTYSASGIIVRPETFARQMAFLRRHFRLLSIDELAEHFATGRRLPSRSCVVTFDDGWFDNFEFALPILRAHNVPATIFVAAGYIGNDSCFWQERLARLFALCVERGGEARTAAEAFLGPDVAAKSAAAKALTIRAALDALKARPASEIEALEARLKEKLLAGASAPLSLGDDRFMTWQQVADLVRGSRVSVGAHGCSHIPLTALSAAQVAQELAESREAIGAATGQAVIAVAYPNGDFNEMVIGCTRHAGYRLGFTTDKGPVSVTNDPLKLSRINMHEGATKTAPDFMCAVLQIFHRLRRAAPTIANANTGNG